MKHYYGFRFFSNHSCTMGHPNIETGNFSIAGAFEVFSTKELLESWIDREKRSAPSGCYGGERVQVTKKELRNLCLGTSVGQFNGEIEYKIEG